MEDSRSQLITKTITKEEINCLPLVKFEGPVHVIDQEADIEAAVAELKKHPVLGFDTETKPAFKKGISYPPALIQFSTLDEAWLFRLKGDEAIHPGLLDIFTNKDLLKVGVALHDDIKHLQEVTDFDAQGFIDVASLAHDAGIKKRGLRNMTGIFLEFRLSKSAQLSNWAQETLTQAQINYASTDAWVSLLLYNKFCELGLDQPESAEQSA